MDTKHWLRRPLHRRLQREQLRYVRCCDGDNGTEDLARVGERFNRSEGDKDAEGVEEVVGIGDTL
jgi:hypothetical protein